MTKPAYRRLRCLRCSVPSPDHPEANKHGGVTLVTRSLCVACHDLLTRRGPDRLRTYRMRADSHQRTLTEACE